MYTTGPTWMRTLLREDSIQSMSRTLTKTFFPSAFKSTHSGNARSRRIFSTIFPIESRKSSSDRPLTSSRTRRTASSTRSRLKGFIR